MKPPTKPAALRPGDAIAVVAPASATEPDRLAAGVRVLRDLGFEVRIGRPNLEPDGYLAGDDADRANELNEAIRDPTVRAIFAARGGYGLSRILDLIDYDALRDSPKIIAGYSDLTALHAAILGRSGVVAFHSPNVVDHGDPAHTGGATTERFIQTVTAAEPPSLEVTPDHPDALPLGEWANGVAEGHLVGGNLAVLTGLVGTPYEFDATDALLMIEDIGEAVYRVDRMLAQLRLAGVLDRVAGVVLGYFSGLSDSDRTELARVMEQYLWPLGIPVLTGAPIGHATPNHTVALGVRYRMDVASGQLVCCEAAVTT